MCEGLDRVEEKGRKEGIDQARLEDIRAVMERYKVTAQEAMDVLKISEEERLYYIAKL